MSTFYDYNVTLFRDSLSTPWGFRLEGGRDFNSPLIVQRVFTGSPASSDLQRGDILLNIQSRDAANLLHHEANDIIKYSGGSLQLIIRRGQPFSVSLNQQSYSYRPQAAIHLSPFANYGYTHLDDPNSTSYVRNSTIERVRDPKPILSQTGSPFLPGTSPNFNQSRSTVKRYRPTHTVPIFTGHNQLPQTNFEPAHHMPPPQSLYHPPTPHSPTFLPYESTNFTATPYHDKRMVSQIHKSLNRAVHTSNNSHPFSGGHNAVSYTTVSVTPVAHHHHQHHQHQPRVPASQQQYSTYEPHHQSSAGMPKSPLPKVVNLQYNSPMGLYSASAVKEELYKKLGNQEIQYPPSSEF